MPSTTSARSFPRAKRGKRAYADSAEAVRDAVEHAVEKARDLDIDRWRNWWKRSGVRAEPADCLGWTKLRSFADLHEPMGNLVTRGRDSRGVKESAKRRTGVWPRSCAA